jgi:hypothetical protein
VTTVLAVWLLIACPCGITPQSPDVKALWAQGLPWETFLDRVTTNRDQWLRNSSRAAPPQDLATRLRKSSADLQFLVVAEDWCPDSVNTVPYVVKLADAAHIETRILNRGTGGPLMDRHRAYDGRRVTPLVVVVRRGQDVGAWVERPVVLQNLFRSMVGDPEKARRFADRQAWYDADGGRSTARELVELVERTEVKH